jgi:hypothetical protein
MIGTAALPPSAATATHWMDNDRRNLLSRRPSISRSWPFGSCYSRSSARRSLPFASDDQPDFLGISELPDSAFQGM